MEENLNTFIEHYRNLVDKEIKQQLEKLHISENLKKSMQYSMYAGGKRLRPVLLMASYETYGNNHSKALPVAAALEMIHTYSLVHDDLPAMDDDDTRRGMPTNHKAFGEATAILAGDALLTYSFEIISESIQLSAEEKAKIMAMLAKTSGPSGMVGGQFLDMEAENQRITLEQLETIHTLKTGELLRFAVYAGAFLGNASEEQLKQLEQYAYYLGLIFQVQDDILDVTGDADKIGKPVGSDETNAKSTYPKLLGLEGAIKKKEEYTALAKEALQKADAGNSYLMALTDYFAQRDH
ncbi:polyprenyl synthetase family protein [Lentibacillus sediminis]|uniref:polyprenyl synthetase family protein n=1 Tax=Lentibacillus sediminis TaxID=1940529 RepID=UPI000C1C4C5F|nr:farnesyl diphosphate synthase [Lentibacillus sediminis]